MTKKQGSATSASQPTIMTLTFTGQGGTERSGTLLITRGDLAQVRQFTYQSYEDVLTAMRAASNDLIGLEMSPPDLSEKRKTKPAQPPAQAAEAPPEPAAEAQDTADDHPVALADESQPESEQDLLF